MNQKIFFTACETSADHHGAELIHELRKLIPELKAEGIGGPEMKQAGMLLHEDMTRISALGFGDVIRQYPVYKKIFEDTVARIKKKKPDLVVCLDSPAFNLRLAKRISKTAPVLYYIAPQLWAWGRRRVHVVQKHIRRMLVILPFEKDFYEKNNVPCSYVGHPLIEKLQHVPDQAACKAKLGLPQQLCIGLFPGSRHKELWRIFPVMLQTAKLLQKQFPGISFHANYAPGLSHGIYGELCRKAGVIVQFHTASFQETVRAMDFALVASGTATLETALLGTPFFLLYKTEWPTYILGRLLVKVDYLGLANLLLNKPVIPEFIQQDAQPEKIADLAVQFLKSPEKINAMELEFLKLREILGPQSASQTAASEIVRFLSN